MDAEPDHYEYDDRSMVCFRCDGDGEVDCHCGGDLCLCGRQEITCPACGGEGDVSQETYARQIAAHREIMTAIWGEGWDNSDPHTAPERTAMIRGPASSAG